jgi:hypothetical protein
METLQQCNTLAMKGDVTMMEMQHLKWKRLLQWHNAFPSSSGDGKGAYYNDIIVKEKKKMKEKEGN